MTWTVKQYVLRAAYKYFESRFTIYFLSVRNVIVSYCVFFPQIATTISKSVKCVVFFSYTLNYYSEAGIKLLIWAWYFQALELGL
jgi:hypothetical protein